MRRREFIKLLGGAATAWPLAARAQQGERMRRIGVLLPATADDPQFQTLVGAFLQELQQLGWSIGRNVRIDIRWATANVGEIRRHAAELATLAPDAIMAHGTSTVRPLLQATRTVPIVFSVAADPVGGGLVDSLARPGGNVTGFMVSDYSIGGKWLELLQQIAPGVTRAAVLRDPTQGSGNSEFAVVQALAPSLRVEVNPIDVRDPAEIERAVAAFARASNGGLIVASGGAPIRHRDLIITLADRYKLPAVTSNASSLPLAGWSPMGLILPTSTGAQAATWTVSLRVRSRPICRCRHRTSTKWCSTSRPPRRSASPCRRPCLPAPTK